MSQQTAETGGIALARCKATCRLCGVVKFQIDSTRERAEQVVRDAMEHHVAEDHDECDRCDGTGDTDCPACGGLGVVLRPGQATS